MRLQYQAKDQAGRLRNGIVVAQNQERAEALLAENGLTIISLSLVHEDILEKFWPFGKGVPVKDMVLFSRQLSTLVGAQVPLLQALRILVTQVSNGRLRQVLAEIVQSIENGDNFSLSLSRYPNIFGTVYVSIVRSGEISGTLDKSLLYLADQLEKDYDLNARIRGAMTYPAFIFVALIGIGSFLFLFVLPKLVDTLTQGGGQLPLITRGLIALTNFMVGYWWLVFGLLIGIIVGFRFFIASIWGRRIWDRVKIDAPIVGPNIIQKIYLARFCRNLSTLVVSGIPIIKALELVAELVNNVIYRDIILDAARTWSAASRYPRPWPGTRSFRQLSGRWFRWANSRQS